MSPVLKLVLLPFFALSIFTGAKNFARNPIIGSRFLNRLGLHHLRLQKAYDSAIWRRYWLRSGLNDQTVRPFIQDGFVAKPGMLSASEIAALRQEIECYKGPARRMIQGDCYTDRILLTPGRLKQFPTLLKLLKRRDFLRLIQFCASKWHRPLFYIQRIHHIRADKADPQKTLHSDTFQPTMKAWLFLEDVEKDGGPFTYVKGSHRYSFQRALYETGVALSHQNRDEPYSGRGSIRVNKQDLASLNYPEASALAVKAGTLVIADTHGFHGRGAAQAGATRLEIFAYSRVSPFNPLPFGLPDPFYLTERGLDLWHRFQDWRAKKKGGNPVWRLISMSDMVGSTLMNGRPRDHDDA